MYDVIFGWKADMPLIGVDTISMFTSPDSKKLIGLSSVVTNTKRKLEADILKEYCLELKEFLKSNVSNNPVIAFNEIDPLDYIDEVEYVLSELEGYNDMDLEHSIYIETFGQDPNKFSWLLKYRPDYIGIKIRIPSSAQSDHSPVQNAIECLFRSISSSDTEASEKTLIILLEKDSSVECLREYFKVVSKAFGEDDRVNYAIGAALFSFDIVIRSEGANLMKILEAQRVLMEPEINLSQRIMVDPTFLKRENFPKV